jgi:hypothetical protein
VGRLAETLVNVPRDRLAELVSAASYGTVLVLAALSVIGVSEVALGHGAELVAGVGVATWSAHLFAEVLGGHVEHVTPRGRAEIVRAVVDGSPILAATVLPAAVLLLARLDVLAGGTARVVAIVVAVAQLFAIGAVVAHVAPAPPAARWAFAASTAGVGLAIVVLTIALGH